MRSSLVAGCCAALALAGLFAACGDDNAPVSPAPTTPVPPVVTTLSVEIAGPRSVAPGQSAQLTAIAHRSDGTTLDVTSTANWRSPNTTAVSISTSGVITGLNLGESYISASSGGRSSTKEVIVVPTGTYRLVGLVGEADLQTVGVVNARVEVIAPTAGPLATSGLDGRFRLYGVPPGNVQIRLSRDGYETRVADVPVSDHQTQNFTLALSVARADIAGTYTLTVAAAGSCSASLPEQTRTRTYTAVVTQMGPQVEVTLTGATFALNEAGKGNRFRGRVEPGQVVFTLNPYHPSFYYYSYGGYGDVVEQIAPSSYLVINGVVAATIAPSRLGGSLDGSIIHTSDPRHRPRPTAPTVECSSTSHQFVLSR